MHQIRASLASTGLSAAVSCRLQPTAPLRALVSSTARPLNRQSHPIPSRRPFSATGMAAQTDMASKHSFLEATVIRRSTIALKKESPISDDQIVSIVKHTILHTPSPFHVQAGRAVILFGDKHEKFWDIAYEAAQKAVPEEMFNSKLSPSLKAYKAAYGTVLFFDDPEAVDRMPPMLGGLIKQFPEWLEHSNGISQYIAWTALCESGLGANLQHFQKYIGPKLNEYAGVPAEWVGKAQLVFGAPGGPPRGGVEKQFADIEPRVKVL